MIQPLDHRTRYVDFVAPTSSSDFNSGSAERIGRTRVSVGSAGRRRRDLLLDAAAAVLHEEEEELSTAAVATRAESSIGTVYRYFSNRDEIVDGLVDRAAQQLAQDVRRRAWVEQPLTPRDALSLLMTVCVEAFERDRLLVTTFEAARRPSAALQHFAEIAREAMIADAQHALVSRAFGRIPAAVAHQCVAIVQSTFACQATPDGAQLQAVLDRVIDSTSTPFDTVEALVVR